MLRLSLRFVTLYAILLVPWPALDHASVAYLQALGAVVSDNISDQCELDFEASPTVGHPDNLRVIIANRFLMHNDGSGPIRNLDFDAPGMVIRPLALIVALILCTPVSWKRRVTAFLWCAFSQQLIIVGALGFCIWHESSEISLVSFSPFTKPIALAIRQMLIAQLDLAVPIVLWIVVMLRRSDARLWSILPGIRAG